MVEVATSGAPVEVKPNPEFPSIFQRVLYWIAGPAAVIAALAALSDDGQKVVAAALGFKAQIAGEVKPGLNPCRRDATWDERVKCQQQPPS